MYEVSVTSRFSAAHSLRHYHGKCERLHGHNWTVEASVIARDLDRLGMVVDFTQLKKKLKRILATLDHRHLNTLAAFKTTNPSSEEIARYIFTRLTRAMKDFAVSRVVVWETEGSRAEYREA